MENKYRQCPHCGGHTKHSSCEICGRRTNVTNSTYVSNDISPQPKYIKTSKNKADDQSQNGHVQDMMKEGRNFQKSPSPKKENSKNKWAIIIAIISIVTPLFIKLFEVEYDESVYDDYNYETIELQFDYFTDYLVNVQDTSPISCAVNEVELDWFYLYNQTPYLYDAVVEINTKNGTESSTIFNGSPLDYEYDVASNEIRSCNVINVKYRNLNIYNTKISYDVVYDDEYHKQIILEEDVLESELEILLKRIYAIQLLTNETYQNKFHVMVKENYKYYVEIDYVTGTMYVTNMDTQNKMLISLNII